MNQALIFPSINILEAEAHDLEACNFQLFFLEQSWGFYKLLAVPSQLVEPPALVAQASRGENGERARYTIYAQIWTKIRSMLHSRKTARATLHSNKKICKLQKNLSSEPELNASRS